MAKNVKVENKSSNGKYGILSMMAMIIGIVIGSGIFVQNTNLMGVNNSPFISILAWILGSLIVLFMLIAFLEIFTITEITNEQSTIGNWGKHLVGIKFGKMIGIYFTYVYFPAASALIISFGADQILSGFNFIDKTTIDSGEYLSYIIAISGIILFLVAAMNATSVTLGKYFQNIGTIIKILPIIFSVLLLLFILLTNISNINFTQKDPSSTVDGSTIQLLFMTIPFVLFSFDGFIFAGSLSKEGKSKTTFRNASIISIISIIFIYISFTLVVFGLGNVSDKQHSYGSITNVIYNCFNIKIASWLAPLINSIIVISIITGASGQMIAASRMSSDLSVSNTIKDVDGQQLKRNKYGTTTTSVATIILFIIQWFFLYIIFDSYYVVSDNLPPGTLPLIAQIQISNLLSILGFVFYSIIIISGLINRITKKIEVKKSSLFIPSAIISASIALIASGYFAYLTFIPLEGEKFSDPSYLIKSIISIIFILEFLILSIFHIINSSKINEKEQKLKYKLIVDYYYGDVPTNISENGYESDKVKKLNKKV